MKVSMKDGSIREASFQDSVGREAFRHTTAHVLAQAVKRLYPDTKCAIGPAIENGFYYDFDFSFSFTEDNLKEVEKEMKKIVRESLAVTRFEMEREEAIAFMKERKESFKIALIERLPEDERLTFYKQGGYTDMCRGPHLSNTCLIKAFQLTSLAGAYWLGDEKNKMLTRIYGTSFPTKDELDCYLNKFSELDLSNSIAD